MANKKTTTATATVAEEVKGEIVDAEKEQLKAKLAEQEEQMAKLMAQMEMMSSMFAASKGAVATEEPRRNITFMSLVKGGMNIRGTRIYHFNNQFETKTFPETEARIIVNNMPRTVQSGMVYITDKKFREDNNLEEYYTNIITPTIFKELFSKPVNEFMFIYNSGCDEQKAIIEDMVADRMFNGESIDANILSQLGKACGKNFLEIEPLDAE